MSNENKGHRERMRARMIKEGLSSFQDHEILEMFLYPHVKYKDTNKIAHNLLANFGSLAGVLNASPQKLMMVKGVGEVLACDIALQKEILLRYKRSEAEGMHLKGINSIVEYARKLLVNCYNEHLLIVYVDAGTNFLLCDEYDSNSTEYVRVQVKDIISTAIRINASGVLMFHTHVKGNCEPSEADLRLTERLFVALMSVNLVLLEHMILNDRNEFFSFHQAGLMDNLETKYKDLER